MKLTWDDVLKDFRRRYPTLRKKIYKWTPCDYAEIMITLKNGDIIIYNYDTKDFRFYVQTEDHKT